jgi:hypothetical protein
MDRPADGRHVDREGDPGPDRGRRRDLRQISGVTARFQGLTEPGVQVRVPQHLLHRRRIPLVGPDQQVHRGGRGRNPHELLQELLAFGELDGAQDGERVRGAVARAQTVELGGGEREPGHRATPRSAVTRVRMWPITAYRSSQYADGF